MACAPGPRMECRGRSSLEENWMCLRRDMRVVVAGEHVLMGTMEIDRSACGVA